MKKAIYIIVIFLFSSRVLFSQVAVNTDGTAPDSSAMLDVKSSSKGMLVPRMNATGRDAIVRPATGLLIFCTDNNQYYSNHGTPGAPNWVMMSSQWLSSGSGLYFSGGNVGIGTSAPATVFDITGGNNWDVINGDGDFRLGNSQYRLKMGVALAGSGAGAVGIMQTGQPGGYNVLSLGAQGHNLLFINGSNQAVGIGTDNPAASLDIHGTFSVVDGTQGAGKVLTSDAAGKASWTNGSSSTWNLAGNNGTSDGLNFIGTTDNVPLSFRVNNQVSGRIEELKGITSLGYQSLKSNSSGLYNTAFGFQSLYANNAGSRNTASGVFALFSNTTGKNNTAVGFQALHANISGYSNVAIGINALKLNTTLSNLVAIGDSALFNNGIGGDYPWPAIGNTAIGSKSLYSNTNGMHNTAIGSKSLYSNTTGTENTAIGFETLYKNNIGYWNTAVGFEALYANTEGIANTALGSNALGINSTGNDNTAIGESCLLYNTIGSENTGTGWYALWENSEGNYNTANGSQSLSQNTLGSNNAAYGYNALTRNKEGFQNTAVGSGSLWGNISGSYNTAVGENSGNAATSYDNTTCLGTDATPTATDQVRLGNIYVNSIGGYADWTHISDGRFKENVKEDVPGLSFINQLRPVTYQLNREKVNDFTGVTKSHAKLKEKDPSMKFSTGEKYSQVSTGFIAQEVEAAAQKIGFNFDGVDAPKNDKDYYGLRYAEFVVPLVKGMQEQQQMIETLKQSNEALNKTVEQLLARIEKLESKK